MHDEYQGLQVLSLKENVNRERTLGELSGGELPSLGA
jgi:hypothetical protein